MIECFTPEIEEKVKSPEGTLWHTLTRLNIQLSIGHPHETGAKSSSSPGMLFSDSCTIMCLWGWSVGFWFLFFLFLRNKCLKMSGNLALKTWGVRSHYEKSLLLSYWSSHHTFKSKCWFHVVIWLARNITLISWYSMSIDYVQNWLHACSVPTPRVPCRTTS